MLSVLRFDQLKDSRCVFLTAPSAVAFPRASFADCALSDPLSAPDHEESALEALRGTFSFDVDADPLSPRSAVNEDSELNDVSDDNDEIEEGADRADTLSRKWTWALLRSPGVSGSFVCAVTSGRDLRTICHDMSKDDVSLTLGAPRGETHFFVSNLLEVSGHCGAEVRLQSDCIKNSKASEQFESDSKLTRP